MPDKKDCEYEEIKVTFPGDHCPKTPDYIICGAGMAGCALIRKLSDQGFRVLALELGKDQSDNPVVNYPFANSLYRGKGPVQSNFFNASYDPELNSFLCNPDVPGDQSRLTPVWAAHMIGGGGGHWFTVYYRPDMAVLDGPLPESMIPNNNVNTMAFAEAGGEKWGSNYINPIIQNFENFRLAPYLGGTPGYSQNPNFRGYSGPESVIQLQPWVNGQPLDPNIAKLDNALSVAAPTVQGGAAAPFVLDYNDTAAGANLNGTSQFQFAIGQDFVRQNTKTMFLTPDVVVPDGNGNLVGINGHKILILTKRQVVRVVKDMKQSKHLFVAKGVEFLWAPNGIQRNYFVKGKNIINCMGAAYGPLMWQRSGIGPSDVLQRAGIPINVESPFIGQNLMSQFGPSINFTSTNPNFLQNFPGVANVQYNETQRRWQSFYSGYGTQTIQFITGASTDNSTEKCQFHLNNTMLNPRSRGYINQISPQLGTATTDLQWGFYSDGPDPYNASSGLYNPPNTAFVGSIDGTTLTVESVTVGTIEVSDLLLNGNGVINGTKIVALGTGTGGVGTYIVNIAQSVSLSSITVVNPANFNVENNDSDIATACAAMDYSYQVFLSLQSQFPDDGIQLDDIPLSLFNGGDKSERYPNMVKYITGLNFAQAHDTGTVVMNVDPAKGAVDGNLKLHGTKNCFHCDKAIFPTQPRGNPGCLIQAIAINAAKLIPKVAMH